MSDNRLSLLASLLGGWRWPGRPWRKPPMPPIRSTVRLPMPIAPIRHWRRGAPSCVRSTNRSSKAGSPYRLNVGVNLNLQYRQQDQRNLLDQFATVRSRTMGATISASQILLNGGRTAAQVSAAEATVLAGRERLRETENAVLFGVVDAYASVLRDQALVAIQTRSLESYGRQVDQAVARERGGDLTRTDIARPGAARDHPRAARAGAGQSSGQPRALRRAGRAQSRPAGPTTAATGRAGLAGIGLPDRREGKPRRVAGDRPRAPAMHGSPRSVPSARRSSR